MLTMVDDIIYENDLDDDIEIEDQQNQPPELGQRPVQEPMQPPQVRQNQQPFPRPIMGRPQVPRPQRNIQFDPNVNVREVDRHHDLDHIGRNSTRSSGIPPINLPQIQPSLLEHRLSSYNREAREAVEQHQQDVLDHNRNDQIDQT